MNKNRIRGQYRFLPARRVKEIFRKYVARVAEVGVRFYFSDDADNKLAQSRFVSSFASFYRSYVEKNYFELDFKPIVDEDAPVAQTKISKRGDLDALRPRKEQGLEAP